MSILIASLGVSAIITMPVDIFPYIDIPGGQHCVSYNRPSSTGNGKRHGAGSSSAP